MSEEPRSAGQSASFQSCCTDVLSLKPSPQHAGFSIKPDVEVEVEDEVFRVHSHVLMILGLPLDVIC